ncbi:hypothetical protein M8Z33_10020 [Streptomyces sp. ZAF1911]|uniref:hypothetical protein n=1 Tax=unclassified Streptomyces TaxID=2593676 RepID=UPI00237BEB58|nr:hypothetical protein [Streptomyces sp. ZAF1911]MDD9376998.1 hypothetical protein [Streptomyces sp. ZAF1911]
MKRSTTMTAAALLTGLTLFVTACTGGTGGSDKKEDGSSQSGGSGGSGGGTDADNALKLRKCLRDNGVDAPDPKPGEDPRGMTVGAGADQEALKKAMEKCGMSAPGGGGEMPQAEKDKALAQAKCMRDHGFDMPDPEFNGNARTGFSLPEGADKDKFMDQLNKCGADK